MRQKVFIFLFLILMVAILAGLNAASYTQKPKQPDSESAPNRSSFNNGSTGTQAFYSLLAETGRRVIRWQEPPSALLTNASPSVFVVIGSLRRPFTEIEIDELMRWVSGGGRLVLIDREPPADLALTTANWNIIFDAAQTPDMFPADSSDQKQMTGETPAAKGVQPSAFTQNVIAVQPSIFAASMRLEKVAGPKPASPESEIPPAAPVVHFAGENGGLVVDSPFGDGRIVLLSDPYIVSNGGIGLVDNAQLAVNLVATNGGLIAFDEFHQGYGSGSNRFIEFFAGTPVIAIFLQAGLLVGLVFFSQSRRFARPVPEPEPDRLSKLEYVAAMAELQNRTRAFDLAIENIYNEFRRRVTRYFGLDNFSVKIGEIAERIAERTRRDRSSVEGILFSCEEIIRGEPVNKRDVVRLAGELRAIERELGLTRSGRRKV